MSQSNRNETAAKSLDQRVSDRALVTVFSLFSFGLVLAYALVGLVA